MRKLAIAAVAALMATAAGAGSASAATTGTPCQIQQSLFYKLGITLEMHQEQLEEAYSEFCAATGGGTPSTGACVIAGNVLRKYVPPIDWYAPEVEYLLSTVCSVTG